MHNVGLKSKPEQIRKVISGLDERGIDYSIHGTPASSSIYVRDPHESCWS